MRHANPLMTLPHDRLAFTTISRHPVGSLGLYWSGVPGEEPWKVVRQGYPDAPWIRAIMTMHAKDL